MDKKQTERLSPERAERLAKKPGPSALVIETDRAFVDWALSRNTHNRPVKRTTIAAYALDMAEGKWGITGQGIAFSRSGWLIDGQHRLIANKEAGYPPIPLVVSFGLPDIAQLNTDSHAKRNSADQLTLALDRPVSCAAAATATWLAYFERDFPRVKVSEPMRMEMFQKYEASIAALHVSTNRSGFSAASSAVLVFAHYHGADPAKLLDFISGASTGENLSRGDPRLAWRRRLVLQKVRNAGAGNDARLYYTSRALYAWLREERLVAFKASSPTRDQAKEQFQQLKAILPLRDF